MTIIAFFFAVGAVAMFGLAISSLSKGRVGSAVLFGLVFLMMASIAGTTFVYGD
jgi:hypothetical protein